MNKTISRDLVRQLYLELLGREPESEETITAYCSLASAEEVRRVILSSDEFALRQRLRQGESGYVVDAERSHAERAVRVEPRGANLKLATSRSYSQRMVFLGDLQAVMLARLVNAVSMSVEAVALEYTRNLLQRLAHDALLWAELDSYDVIWYQHDAAVVSGLKNQSATLRNKCRMLAKIECSAFHPDCVTVLYHGVPLAGPTGTYHSALVLWGYLNKLTPDQIQQLFHLPVFRLLGYLDRYAQVQSELNALDAAQGSGLAAYHAKWRARGVWMHAPDRPKSFVLADVAKHCLAQFNEYHVPAAEECVEDLLSDGPVWPVYPPIAKHFGWEGAYAFKIDRDQADDDKPVQHLSLNQFVQASYAVYDTLDSAYLYCDALRSPQFQSFHSWFHSGQHDKRNFAIHDLGVAKEKSNLLDGKFWRKSVSVEEPSSVDPVSEARFCIQSSEEIVAFGTCFAQQLRQTMGGWASIKNRSIKTGQRSKLLDADGAMVQSVKQLLQLFEISFGIREPGKACWVGSTGGILDPLRFHTKTIKYADEVAMLEARQRTMAHFSESVRECDVMVITLGQTQLCRRRHDGLIVNYPPDFIGHDLYQGIYDHVNPRLGEVLDDLEQVLRGIKAVNPGIKLLLTVSSNPLVVTYDDQSVLSANHSNKSMLRVVCDEMRRRYDWVDYFPSYEILTGTFHRGKYLDDDLRTVTPAGHAHLWHLFSKHYLSSDNSSELLIHH